MARQAKPPKPAAAPPPSEQLLTQENFEKELKALAAKAKDETWLKWAKEQSWVLIRSGTLLTLAAVYSNVSQLTLSPVYGSIPSAIWHSRAVMTACFVGWSSNLFIRRRLPLKPQELLPLIAAYIPVMQFFLFKISGNMGALFGPLIIEMLTLLPLLVLSVSCTATVLDDLEMSMPIGRFKGPWLSEAMPGISSYAFFKTVEYYSNNFLQRTIGSDFLHTRLGCQVWLAHLFAIFAPSKLLYYTIPAILHTAFLNVHVQYPYTTDVLNSTLAKYGWQVLARQESLTGYMSVIESAQQGFRVMRCDHSVLGGEWLAKSNRNALAEPIYGVFMMLEAVRLVEVKKSVPDSEANALVIGLGIGTTPAALMAHGIETTIVEIDPVVHDYATKYFALPTNHKKVIEDAVSYAAKLVQRGEKYDYIVNDVFTGGAEPVDLFTFEFLSDLNTILKPGGVIAINYAGDLLLPSARIIVQTIKTVFPTCRIFRESEAPPASKIQEEGLDFTNMVIFCTNAASTSSSAHSLTFRKPREEDFLGSRARRMFLLPTHEVDYSVFEMQEGDGGILRRNDTVRFRPWQETSASGHWAVMRTVLPDQVWENW